MNVVWVIVGCIVVAAILMPLSLQERSMVISAGGVGLLWVISNKLTEIHKTLLEIRKSQLGSQNDELC